MNKSMTAPKQIKANSKTTPEQLKDNSDHRRTSWTLLGHP